MAEVVVIKLALIGEKVELLKTLLDQGCDCEHCVDMPEKDQIKTILGIDSHFATLNFIGLSEDDEPLPMAKPCVILDARIENRMFEMEEIHED